MSDDDISIADDMLSGLCCSECGMFFEVAHGFPVLCKSCWSEYLASGDKVRRNGITPEGLQKAFMPEAGE